MGCKAEIIETKIKTEKLKIAISQKFTTIPFKAKITLMGDEKDTRQQMETFQNISKLGQQLNCYYNRKTYTMTIKVT